MSRRKVIIGWGILLTVLMVSVLPASAIIISPGRGGDNLNDNNDYPMIMPMITVSGTNIVVKDMMGNPWMSLQGDSRPVMRPLSPGHELQTGTPWYTPLNGTAWNWQYGWASGMLNKNLIPADCNIFITLLDQSAGISTYDRTGNSYASIFTSVGSTWRWNWNMGMQHNAYTVIPQYGQWQATYRVYLGNTVTGAPIAGWNSDTVTLTWTSIPEPATMGLLGTGFLCLLFRKNRKQE